MTDISERILTYLTELSYVEILKTPPDHNCDTIRNTFRELFNNLFAIDLIDFYCDFEPKDFRLADIPNPQFKTTRYSQDYPKKKCSALKAYDRQERLRYKGNIPYTAIDFMRYTQRIEFSMNRYTCNHLHIQNINCDYNTIFNRYLPKLAQKWRDYGEQVAYIPHWFNLPYAYYFSQIVALSKEMIPHGNLLRTPPKPIPYKRYTQQDVDRNWAVEFILSQWI